MVLVIIIKNICELSIENIRDIISILISFSALSISIFSFISTNKVSRLQREVLEKQKYPNLKIFSVDITKSSPKNSTVYDGTYCRIFSGKTGFDVSLNNNIATFDADDVQIEKGFIEEIKSNIGSPNAYFTYFGSNPFLIANHATNPNSFVIDHSNVKILLHNYGALINSLSINSLIVYYKKEMNLANLTFYGDDKNIITLSLDDNNNFVLYFDEVTTYLNNSLCQIPENIYRESPVSFNLLKTHMPENILTYNKLELNLNCWDLYNKKTKLQITLEYKGNFFVSSTSILT